jgi:hypothetical protein
VETDTPLVTDEQRLDRARRATIVALAGLSALAVLGLFAWGPMPASAASHHYADGRPWLGVPNAANVLVNVPIFWCAAWGWCATRTSPWPRSLRMPWQGFHLWVMVGSLVAAMYHVAPSDARYIASHVCSAGAALMLSMGLMAERVDTRWGSNGACVVATLIVVSVGMWAAYAPWVSAIADVRPLMLLQGLPLLLIVAGVLRLPPARPCRSGWPAVLALYACAKVLEWADALIFTATGWISGHTLMHVCSGLIVAWMAYRASAELRVDGTTSASGAALNQRSASLNTTG